MAMARHSTTLDGSPIYLNNYLSFSKLYHTQQRKPPSRNKKMPTYTQTNTYTHTYTRIYDENKLNQKYANWNERRRRKETAEEEEEVSFKSLVKT